MDFFTQLLDFLKTYGTPVVLVWSLVETDLVFLVVGALVSAGNIHPVLGFLAAILGALTHDCFVFWLAKNRAAWVRSREAYKKFAASVEKLANKTGPWQLALCRPLYGTRYPAVIYWGLRDLPFPRFLSFTLAGMIPWTLLLATIGFQLSGHIDQFDDWLKEAKNLIFGGVLTIAALLYLRHRLNRRKSQPSPETFPTPDAQGETVLPQNGANRGETVSPVSPETVPTSGHPR